MVNGERKIVPTEEPVQVESLEDLATLIAQELGNPSLQSALNELESKLNSITGLDAIGFVVRNGEHLSVYAFTDFNARSKATRDTIHAVRRALDEFDQEANTLHSGVRSDLSYVATGGTFRRSMIHNLKRRVTKEDASLVSFIVKSEQDKPATQD